MGETLAQARHRYATVDNDEALERMLTEIGLGIPKEEAASVYDEETSARWDRITAEVRSPAARRMVLSYDLEGG